MDDEEDYIEAYEMACTVAEWDGQHGYMLSEDGQHISLSDRMLERRGVTVPLKVGDRIHCWVTVEMTVRLEKIRLIEPREPDADHIRGLKALGKAIVARRHGRLRAEVQFHDTFAGTIESFNARSKKGVICRDDGMRLSFDRGCLDSKRLTKIKPGMTVRFRACCFEGIWSVLKIVSIGGPSE